MSDMEPVISTRTVWLPAASVANVPLVLKLPLASVLAHRGISQAASLEVPIRRIAALGAAFVTFKVQELSTQYLVEFSVRTGVSAKLNPPVTPSSATTKPNTCFK